MVEPNRQAPCQNLAGLQLPSHSTCFSALPGFETQKTTLLVLGSIFQSLTPSWGRVQVGFEVVPATTAKLVAIFEAPWNAVASGAVKAAVIEATKDSNWANRPLVAQLLSGSQRSAPMEKRARS